MPDLFKGTIDDAEQAGKNLETAGLEELKAMIDYIATRFDGWTITITLNRPKS